MASASSPNLWRKPIVWTWIGIVLFVIWFGVSAWFRHVNFYTAQFDLGNMDSVIWHSLHGKLFVMTNPTQLIQELRTSIHADFLLLSGVPLYLIWSDPRMLMWLQVVVVASGALPIFWLGRRWLGPRWGGLFSWIYLWSPLLLWGVIFDFHAVTLVAALIPWMVWSMHRRHWWVYGISGVAALLAKEEIGLLVGLLGVYFLFTKQHRWWSIGTIALGFGWSALMLGWAIPSASPRGRHFALSYFADYGQSSSEVFRTILTNPVMVLKDFFGPAGRDYWLMLLWPYAFLPLLGLPFLLLAMPEFGINLLSDKGTLRQLFFHYASPIVPFLVLSSIIGLSWLFRRWRTQTRFRFAIGTVLISTWLIGLYVLAPLPYTKHKTSATDIFKPSPYRAAVADIKSMVKPTDRLTVSNKLAPHFTQREWSWSFPLNLENADGAIVLLGGWIEAGTQAELQAAVDQLMTDPNWELRLHQDQLYYFNRKSS